MQFIREVRRLALPAEYLESKGAANLEVVGTDGGAATESFAFSAATANSPAASEDSLVDTADRPQHVSFDLARSTVTTALGATPAHTAPTANGADAAGPAALAAPALASPVNCRPWVKQRTFSKRSEHFMDIWTVGPATVAMHVGSAHSLGVGVAVTGGNWTASGSVTVEASRGVAADRDYGQNYAIGNYVNYAHYTSHCISEPGSGVRSYYRHQVGPVSLNAPLAVASRIKDHVWATTTGGRKNRCTLYSSGNFSKTAGSNITFEGGVDAPYISLSAEASYSKETSVTWHGSHAWLCGSDQSGWAHAPYAGEDKNPYPSTGGCGRQCGLATTEDD